MIRYLFRAFKYRYRTDSNEIAYMLKKLKSSDIAVDIGCHKGGYIYWMRKKIKHGTIYAFEPQKPLCAYLKKIIKIFGYDNIIIENQALGAVFQKENDFFIPITKKGNSPGASMSKLHAKVSYKKSSIATTTLDQYFFEHKIYPNFIKIDVEGFEKNILLGGIRLLKHAKPTIIMECEQRLIGEKTTVFDVFEVLLRLGYQGFFYRKGKKISIEKFNSDIDQNFSYETFKYKGAFVNNFIFEYNAKQKYPEALQCDIFKIISEVATKLNLQTYVIGGFVRNYFLNENSENSDKKKDIDIVVLGDAIFLAQQIAAILPNQPKLQFFKNYGVAMFRYKKYEIEFVGARKESYSKESRNPKVTPGTLQDDQNRRDFTINTLALNLHKNNFGEFLDPFSGREDLKNKIIKTPLNPETTYSDDPLRMLRAIRFATELHFTVQKNSLQAISDCADRIKIITQERIVSELNKIILTKKPSEGFLLLEQTGLLAFILPELLDLKGVEEVQGQKHKDNFYHTLEVLDNIAKNTENIWLRWAALLHDIGKAPTKKFSTKNGWTFHNHEYVGAKMVHRIFKRLKMPLNQKVKYVQKMVYLSARPIALTGEVTDSAMRRLLFDAGEDLEDLMTLCKADITTKNPKKFAKYHRNFEEVSEKIKQVEEKDRIKNFQPPISGEMIMETFNLKPGKEIGIIKEHIKEAILEGNIPNDYEQAYALMLKKAENLGLKTI